MSSVGPDLDVFETLSRRRGLLECLEDGTRSKRGLVEDLGVSRSTIDRGIRELEYFDFVERVDSDYRLTAAGMLALSQFCRSVDALESIADFRQILEYVPRTAPLSIDVLDGAIAHEPEPHAPNAPIEVIIDRLEDAQRMRGFTAAERLPALRYELYTSTVAGELTAEAIFTDELAEFLLRTYPDQMAESMSQGQFDMFSIPSIPYGLGLIETPTGSYVFLVVFGESKDIRGIIENDSRAAFEWADALYRRFRARAAPLSPPRTG